MHKCDRCGMEHHAETAVQKTPKGVFCFNTDQCSRRLGPNYSHAKAIKLCTGAPVARLLQPRSTRAIYTDGRLLFCVGIRPPKYPLGVTWLKYQSQRYVRSPKILWCGSGFFATNKK